MRPQKISALDALEEPVTGYDPSTENKGWTDLHGLTFTSADRGDGVYAKDSQAITLPVLLYGVCFHAGE